MLHLATHIHILYGVCVCHLEGGHSACVLHKHVDLQIIHILCGVGVCHLEGKHSSQTHRSATKQAFAFPRCFFHILCWVGVCHLEGGHGARVLHKHINLQPCKLFCFLEYFCSVTSVQSVRAMTFPYRQEEGSAGSPRALICLLGIAHKRVNHIGH